MLIRIFKLDKPKKEIDFFLIKNFKQNFKRKINFHSHRKLGTVNLYKRNFLNKEF